MVKVYLPDYLRSLTYNVNEGVNGKILTHDVNEILHPDIVRSVFVLTLAICHFKFGF